MYLILYKKKRDRRGLRSRCYLGMRGLKSCVTSVVSLSIAVFCRGLSSCCCNYDAAKLSKMSHVCKFLWNKV